MSISRPATHFCAFLLLLAAFGCASLPPPPALSQLEATPLAINPLAGDFAPVRDPSIALQNGTYYLFSTDPADPDAGEYLSIRCSADRTAWMRCGQVFTAMPEWVEAALPGLKNLWAPDISYFNGLYHLYYSGSTLESQASVIGLATNTTLDAAYPSYRWVDRGQVIASHPGDDFNAIDPNILVDSDKRVWLTYGSYWTGIKQREIDPATGLLLASNPVRYQLAARPYVADHAEEGASLIREGSFYYLFLSVDHCCAGNTSQDDYKQIVGRSSSPHGPFFDAQGTPLMEGGGSILLKGNSRWMGPGGGAAYLDRQTGKYTFVFHALNMSHGGNPSLWVKALHWQNGWPVLE